MSVKVSPRDFYFVALMLGWVPIVCLILVLVTGRLNTRFVELSLHEC